MKVHSAIDVSESRLCAFLKDLIRIDTSNPPGRNYLQCVQFLERRLQELGLKTEIHQVPDEVLKTRLPDYKDYPRYTVFGRWEVGAPKTVHFNAHYDVVPAGNGWTSPPFEPEIRDGWLYGRGANDMKGSIAALLGAIEAIREVGEKPRMNVEIVFVPDEETDSSLGTGYIVDEKLVNADYAVVCEGGWLDTLGCGHSGVMWMEVTVRGKSAHASRPHLGINAFEKAAALCLEFEKYKEVQRKRIFRAPGGEELSPPLTLGGEIKTDPGNKINTIPGEFTFTIDRRIMPDESEDQVEADLREFLQGCTERIPDLDIEVRKISSRHGCVIAEDDPLVENFLEAVRRERPNAKCGMTSGFIDMSFYANEGNIPCVGYGVKGKNTHGIDEGVEISDLLTVAKVYANFLTGWSGESD